jgi:hypothetical protein
MFAEDDTLDQPRYIGLVYTPDDARALAQSIPMRHWHVYTPSTKTIYCICNSDLSITTEMTASKRYVDRIQRYLSDRIWNTFVRRKQPPLLTIPEEPWQSSMFVWIRITSRFALWGKMQNGYVELRWCGWLRFWKDKDRHKPLALIR